MNKRFIIAPLTVLFMVGFFASFTGCDRGAGEEVGVAKKFADAVASNNAIGRDTMIATQKFKDDFQNAYVANDILMWFRSFYDYRHHKFLGTAKADVDYNLAPKLQGALIDTNKIEETGMVMVQPTTPGSEAAFFWLVHQKNAPWRVAVVTKGEEDVNFQ